MDYDLNMSGSHDFLGQITIPGLDILGLANGKLQKLMLQPALVPEDHVDVRIPTCRITVEQSHAADSLHAKLIKAKELEESLAEAEERIESARAVATHQLLKVQAWGQCGSARWRVCASISWLQP